MNIIFLTIREIAYRKLNFLLCTLAAAIAVSTFLITSALLKSTDLETEKIIHTMSTDMKKELDKLEDEMRKSMKGLGFNIYIFPENQDMSEVYDKGYASETMPEEYVTKLAKSQLVTINHLLPSLTQKITWPEQKRTVILIGIRSEEPIVHRQPMKPLIEPVEEGKLVLGYELHNSLKIKTGDRIKLMDREFTVSLCHKERGTTDDITVWMSLAECQELLNLKGRINSILALECNCTTSDRLAEVRKELHAILPGTKIIEKGSQALARAEARTQAQKTSEQQLSLVKIQRQDLKSKHEALAAMLVPLVGILSLAGIGLLLFINARERISEIGIFLAIGLKPASILLLFLVKAVVNGFVGSLLGIIVSIAVVSASSATYFHGYCWSDILSTNALVLLMIVMPLFSALAAWLPSFWAAQQDPVEVLRNE